MLTPKVELWPDGYSIVAWKHSGGDPEKPDYEGGYVDYGEVAELTAEGVTFNSLYRLDEQGEPEYCLTFPVCIVKDAKADELEYGDDGDEGEEIAVAEVEGDEPEDDEEEEDEGPDEA